MLSLDFFESWWIVLSRKNPTKLFSALWIPIWMLLNVLAESVLNSDFITMSFRTQSLKNSTKIRREATILSLNFLKADGQYFAGKIQEHYFRYSGCLFGRHWMCWLNRFQNTFGNAFIPKYALPQLVLQDWSLDCMYRSYTDDILVWWL